MEPLLQRSAHCMNCYQSDKYHLRIAYETRIGGRPENQDALALSETPLGFLAVVCDGMGGGPGGATASTLAAKTIVATLKGCTPLMPCQQALKLAVDHAQTALENAMRSNPALQGMGSTLVALLLSKESALIAHLGDSRCYRLSRGRMAFRTKDHSLVGELVQYGSMTEEQARRSPTANVITRGLGATSNHVAQIDEVPYRQGDRFVLCTDGVWGSMPQPQLLAHMMPPKAADDVAIDLPQAVDRLGEQNGNHHDNHTLIVIDTDTQSILKDKMGKREIILCTAFAVLLVISMVVNGVLLSKLAAYREQAETTKQEQDEMLARVHQAYQGEDIDGLNSITVGLIVEAEKKALVAQAEADSLKALVQQLEERFDSLQEGAGVVAGAQEGAPNLVDSVLCALDSMLIRYQGEDPNLAKKNQMDRAARIHDWLAKINKQTDRVYANSISRWWEDIKKCRDANMVPQKGQWCVTDDIQKELKRIKKEIADTFKTNS